MPSYTDLMPGEDGAADGARPEAGNQIGGMKLTLKQTLLLGLAVVLVIALVPGALALDRYLGGRLEESARADLGRAPMVLADRNASRGDALMMHARELAGTVGLAEAVAAGRSATAAALVEGVPPEGEAPVLATPEASLVGPAPTPEQLAATREGKAPVGFVLREGHLYVISVAPVEAAGRWVGAAGVSSPVDAAVAGTLSGLTASEVAIVAGDSVVASTMEPDVADRLAARAAAIPADGAVRELALDGRRFWLAAAPLGSVGRVLFAVDQARELALLPDLRRGALFALLLALGLALVLGGLLATGVARPVGALATAADRLAAGDFDAPLDASRIDEVDRMARAFARMRSALRSRLDELSRANEELAERQDRLQALQSELIRRDRLAASGRLVTELAHEIRNPVANIRNCLEVVHRRLSDDPEGRRFADLAIDELLRMHELAEQMLDLNRPMDPGAARADPLAVLEQVAALYRAGAAPAWPIHVRAKEAPVVAMPPDTLKQVLLNLVQNAREVMPDGGSVWLRLERDGGRAVIEVVDEGPGLPDELLDRIFDPFFTTKGEVSGVGLGLFIAHGLVSRFDGRLEARDRFDGPGAVFRIEIPVARDAEGTARDGAEAAGAKGTDGAARGRSA
jgi:signal transduction histidine kinase